MSRKRPAKRENRKKPREVEPEKPDGLPETTSPTPQWVLEMQRRLK